MILFQGSYASMKLILAAHQRKNLWEGSEALILRTEENNSKTFMVQLISTWDRAHMVYTCRQHATALNEILL